MATNNVGDTSVENTNQESQVEKKLKKTGIFNLLLSFLLVGSLVYSGFLQFYHHDNIVAQTSVLEEKILATRRQIDDIKIQKVDVSQNAIEALEKIEADEIHWSSVIDEVNKLLPVDSSGKRLVRVLSYSGSGKGSIVLNMVTESKALPPFNDVAQLISIFNGSVFFRNAYVPAISIGNDSEGGTTLSFVLNMEFEKPETGSDALPLPKKSRQSEGTVKVPRNNQ